MGYIRHHAIIVTGTDFDTAVADAHAEATRLGCDVSPIVDSKVNGYRSFFVAPDGGKEGRDSSNEGDERRASLVAYLRAHVSCDWVEVMYGDDEHQCWVVHSRGRRRKRRRTPRGTNMNAGGDGSPQLDLDAIEREWGPDRPVTRRFTYWGETSRYAYCGELVMALVAFARRLQQENEELRAWLSKSIAAVRSMDAAADRRDEETDALRGRVEELTEALRAVKADRPSAHSDAVWQKINAALARVVPEKETP